MINTGWSNHSGAIGVNNGVLAYWKARYITQESDAVGGRLGTGFADCWSVVGERDWLLLRAVGDCDRSDGRVEYFYIVEV